ncbi:transcriptional regulator, TetR family [Beutenbergia cavernae DSM 12333]|uniref:Transcriptional regulator, TetR family n=1 Tax=Beutenbergia cavernae (strain ATCC BAA-8 / DSM 12333 / CCUG 43141 / JCM 11478 / NBRC 16432 / NCIMB 13614 / HKI 0122) TaxID=471853 RepID=C5BVX7_BEUC1|nr:TetR/AcrR family transcriptional regulator [Beutenbergia cavernae]ACQ80578.1 transcriptional regulator, TetR family [Beutenbergia cavernae DSM 12333]
MPRASRAESERTRARIVDVARTAFTAHGYQGVGLERIARDAGVTRGAVYHHFADKEALFAAVLDGVQASVAERIVAATADVSDPRRSLEIGSRAFLEACLADANRRILLVDAVAVLGWDVWREHDARHGGRTLTHVLGQLADADRLRGLDPAAAAVLLSGAMNEAAVWAATAGGDLEAAWAVLERLIDAVAE